VARAKERISCALMKYDNERNMKGSQLRIRVLLIKTTLDRVKGQARNTQAIQGSIYKYKSPKVKMYQEVYRS